LRRRKSHQESAISADIAIIGAGLAGCTCASALARHGLRVLILEKSGDIGGRLATRRRPKGHWNHGAPALSPGDPAFTQFLGSLESAGTAQREDGPGGLPRFQGLPDMRELLRPLVARTPLAFNTLARRLFRRGASWMVETEFGDQGPFRAVVVALPAPQATDLLARSRLDGLMPPAPITMAPVWTLLLGFDEQRPPPAPADRRIVERVIPQTHRPGDRPGWCAERWVVHATARWSSDHVELDAADAGERLLRALAPSLADGDADRPDVVMTHRWRFAQTTSPMGRTHLWDPDTAVGLAGDWCLGATAEDAFTSGGALARDISKCLLTDSAKAQGHA
jgi:predicted NAD/FAD-dependent oxidoreductase